MQKFLEKYHSWLLPVLLIIFVAQVITLPFAMGLTVAEPGADHTLAYFENDLTWFSGESIRPDGSAEIDLFDATYPGVQSGDGRNVIAPGTGKETTLRLRNFVLGKVKYRVVLYWLKQREDIPVYPVMTAAQSVPKDDYPLPEGVTEADVISVYGGTIPGGEARDFVISWDWDFYVDDAQDVIDTALGNEVPPGEISVGVYIVVEDNNSYVNPKTSDDSGLWLHLALMLLSFIALVLVTAEYVLYKKQRALDEIWEESEESSM